ncbi:MAG: TonB-dependent receptor [Bacteroidota bacterium]
MKCNPSEKITLKPIKSSLFILLLLMPGVALANFSFNDAPLRSVVQEIQQETGYFFLYRESQLAGHRLTFESSSEEIFDELQHQLAQIDLTVSVNHSRKQVLITQRTSDTPPASEMSISGQVVDASTGERLPFATLTWQENGSIDGVASGSSGRFEIRERFPSADIELTITFIGYQQREVTLDGSGSRRFEDLTIRLAPKTVEANEIVVSGFTGFNPADTLLSGMIDAGRFSPLGESNSIRALKAHPSVGNGPALNDGMNIRGSAPDGFRVLLDGMSIFNQSHLYGLLDSFNADAVQSSGFYYGVTPASIESPTGGSLNLITRTGSRTRFRNSAGVSNTSVNGTFEGPIGERSSWMVSARTSYIDAVNWFNNKDLVQWGLGVDRPRRVAGDQPDFTDLVLRTGDSSARFIDLHTKFYSEATSKGRFIFSGYFGGNRISQQAKRRTRRAGSGGQFMFEPVETSNSWGNALVSLAYEQEWSDDLYSTTLAGVSAYETDFSKDDFVYSGIDTDADAANFTVFTYPFQNRSAINEYKVNQEIQWKQPDFKATVGGTWRYYSGAYNETSFDRPSFSSETSAHLADGYLQADWNPFTTFELDAGSRVYLFGPDTSLRFAPRVQARFIINDGLQFYGGYAVNYQFLHKVSIQNSTSADVWILSTGNQPPASSRQITAGLQFTAGPGLFASAEIYQKTYDNIRFHELNTRTLTNTFSGTPWFYQNRGDASGLELILRNRWNGFTLSQTYSWSEITYRNPFLLDGESFFADWDRTHTYNAVLETNISNGLALFLSWISMSGAPNSLATFGADNQERLAPYHRLDATFTYSRRFSNESKIMLSLSVFNLLDIENVWYRTYDFNFDETRAIPRLRPIPVDVLDLGFQPSFKVQYSF